MDKLLTVVIPSYNVEKFLNQTLDSFVCDEDVMKKFEVIVVDDGSKDNTAKIGKEYADKYPDTFRVISRKTAVTAPLLTAVFAMPSANTLRLWTVTTGSTPPIL